MARGDIYEVSKDVDTYDLFMMDESDFYADLDAIGADYVKNSDDPKSDIEFLFSVFSQYGAKTGYEKRIIDGKKVKVPYFKLPKKFRKRYFKRRFIEFKEEVSKMKLKDFAESDPYHLRFLLQDTIGDAVYYENCFHTMDTFLRDYAEPGVRYYVGNVVFMH